MKTELYRLNLSDSKLIMIRKIANNVIVCSFIAIICFWFIDAAIDYYFHYDESFQYVLFEAKKEITFRLLFAVCILTVAIIINKLSQTKKTLVYSEERYRSLVECTDDSIYVVDSNCRYLFINKRHMSRLNLREDQYKGRGFSEFHSLEDTNWFKEIVNKVVESGISAQHEHKSTDGKYFALTLSPVKSKEGQIIAVTIISKEITKIKLMEEKFYALSITDDLTKLYNRRGFLTLAEHQLKIVRRDKRRTFLLYADLDNLKEINDTLGHAEGDTALIEFSNILRATYRESDIIARIGGDEFVVYPAGTSDDNADTISARLQNNIEMHNAKRQHKFKLSVSLGIVLYDPETSHTIDELMVKADKLMYEIKKQRYKYHFQSVIID